MRVKVHTTSFGDVEVELIPEDEFYDMVEAGDNPYRWNETTIGYINIYAYKTRIVGTETMYDVYELGKRSLNEICKQLNGELIHYSQSPIKI